MEGDVRSSSDEMSDSSVDNPNKTSHLPVIQQNGTPKKGAVKENGISNQLITEAATAKD